MFSSMHVSHGAFRRPSWYGTPVGAAHRPKHWALPDCTSACSTLPHFPTRRTACQYRRATKVPEAATAGSDADDDAGHISAEELANICDLGRSRATSDGAELAGKLGCAPATGLQLQSIIEENRARYGANALPEPSSQSFFELVVEAFDDFTLQVLLVAGALSLGLWCWLEREGSGWIDGAAILAAVGVVVLVSATTNYQRDLQFRALSAEEQNIQVRVRRDAQEQMIPVQELVVGDVLLLASGDILPADGLLLDGFDVRADESHLTGESEDVTKSVCGDARLFSGSKVVMGYGSMLVVAVGERSQSGRIMQMARGDGGESGPEEGAGPGAARTPKSNAVLQEKLERLAGAIGRFGAAAAVVTFAAQLGGAASGRAAAGDWSLDFLREAVEYVINAITILVVAVPEGLPLAVTMALAFSVRRMLSDNNLVRHLYACETMATCTSICSDKTGTLTRNQMRVVRGWAAGQHFDSVPALSSADLLDAATSAVPAALTGVAPAALRCITRGAALNSTANLDRNGAGGVVENGNRTECALLRFACTLGADVGAMRRAAPVIGALPFSSERKRMSVVVSLPAGDEQTIGGGGNGSGGSGNGDGSGRGDGGGSARSTESQGAQLMLYCKGASEIVLERCTRQMLPDGTSAPLSDADKRRILDASHGDGLRFVAIAQRPIAHEEIAAPGPPAAAIGGSGVVADGNIGCTALDPALESGLELVALFGISDEVRPEVPGAVRSCQAAGITVRMLTGDSARTAQAIALDCGILQGNGHVPSSDEVMEGAQFHARVHRPDGAFDQAAFNALWPRLRVLARCSPQDKYTIIKGCQAYRLPGGRRDIVAMTGDGTNDAPALRLADVGFAMVSGTSIARQASDILLMDDNFLSIVQSVKWGRNVYASIIKFLQFQLTINVVAVVTAVAGVLLLHRSPLTPVQMLWVNMIMDSLASLSLATEPPTASMLTMPPFSSNTSLLTPTCVKHIVGQATYQLLVMAFLLTQGQELLHMSPSEHMTFVFNTFVVIQLFNQVACRKAFDEANILDDLLNNRIFLGVLAVEALLQVLIVEYGGEVFDTVSLSPQLWLCSMGFGAFSWIVRSALLAVPTAKFEVPLDDAAAAPDKAL